VVCAALAAGAVSLATAAWPFNTGLLAAIAAGVAVGLTVARIHRSTNGGRAA
jgi:hypothetical protein